LSFEKALVELHSFEHAFVFALPNELLATHVRRLEVRVQTRQDHLKREVALDQQLVVAQHEEEPVVSGCLSCGAALQVVQLLVGNTSQESLALGAELLAERVLAESCDVVAVLESEDDQDVGLVGELEQPLVPAASLVAFEESLGPADLASTGDSFDGVEEEVPLVFVVAGIKLGLN
jgi:hypothetical protein